MIPKIKKILYATDLSDTARHAAAYAAFMADRFGAKLSLLYVIEILPTTGKSLVLDYIGEDQWNEIQAKKRTEYEKNLKRQVEAFCRETSEEMPECPLLVEETLIREGDPAEAIVRESADFDLVVIGTHGRNAVAETLLGNTARRVVRRCSVPVTVVRLPEENA
ncbi:MAG: universal stress protein [Desulfococcaceae bacterium]